MRFAYADPPYPGIVLDAAYPLIVDAADSVWKQRAEQARRDLIDAEVALRAAGDTDGAHAAHMAGHHAIGEECG